MMTVGKLVQFLSMFDDGYGVYVFHKEPYGHDLIEVELGQVNNPRFCIQCNEEIDMDDSRNPCNSRE